MLSLELCDRFNKTEAELISFSSKFTTIILM